MDKETEVSEIDVVGTPKKLDLAVVEQNTANNTVESAIKSSPDIDLTVLAEFFVSGADSPNNNQITGSGRVIQTMDETDSDNTIEGSMPPNFESQEDDMKQSLMQFYDQLEDFEKELQEEKRRSKMEILKCLETNKGRMQNLNRLEEMLKSVKMTFEKNILNIAKATKSTGPSPTKRNILQISQDAEKTEECTSAKRQKLSFIANLTFQATESSSSDDKLLIPSKFQISANRSLSSGHHHTDDHRIQFTDLRYFAKCPFCWQSKHRADRCRVNPLMVMREHLRSTIMLCSRCLTTHPNKKCSVLTPCAYCGKRDHHKSMCFSEEHMGYCRRLFFRAATKNRGKELKQRAFKFTWNPFKQNRSVEFE